MLNIIQTVGYPSNNIADGIEELCYGLKTPK